ncbi:9930_t:CDS:2 [Funneliformis geosporum]|nr:9930_t:CDS:2 [Funneliformis geosporum]
MSFEFLTKLSQSFSQLLDETDDYDIIIRVGEDQDINVYHAHSIILKTRSPYFKRALSKNWITKKNNMNIFNKPNISPRIFDMIIREKDATNLCDWSENDFMELESALNQFIEYIRFCEISSKEFYSRVWPFKKVLPETLIENIVSFYNENTTNNQNNLIPRLGNVAIGSLIIQPKHAAIISNWIQRKEFNARIPKGSKYRFDLVYRKSRDGHDINTIRRECNGLGACVLIIKTKEDHSIIGGYNPLGWNDCNLNTYNTYDDNSSSYKYSNYYYWANTSESFIFSLGNGRNLKNFKISRVVDYCNAIYESNHRNISLNFGNSDLVIKDDTGLCKVDYYESRILDSINFTIEEMEIFRFYQSE